MLAAAFIITVLSASMLKIAHMREKWERKLQVSRHLSFMSYLSIPQLVTNVRAAMYLTAKLIILGFHIRTKGDFGSRYPQGAQSLFSIIVADIHALPSPSGALSKCCAGGHEEGRTEGIRSEVLVHVLAAPYGRAPRGD